MTTTTTTRQAGAKVFLTLILDRRSSATGPPPPPPPPPVAFAQGRGNARAEAWQGAGCGAAPGRRNRGKGAVSVVGPLQRGRSRRGCGPGAHTQDSTPCEVAARMALSGAHLACSRGAPGAATSTPRGPCCRWQRASSARPRCCSRRRRTRTLRVEARRGALLTPPREAPAWPHEARAPGNAGPHGEGPTHPPPGPGAHLTCG